MKRTCSGFVNIVNCLRVPLDLSLISKINTVKTANIFDNFTGQIQLFDRIDGTTNDCWQLAVECLCTAGVKQKQRGVAWLPSKKQKFATFYATTQGIFRIQQLLFVTCTNANTPVFQQVHLTHKNCSGRQGLRDPECTVAAVFTTVTSAYMFDPGFSANLTYLIPDSLAKLVSTRTCPCL